MYCSSERIYKKNASKSQVEKKLLKHMNEWGPFLPHQTNLLLYIVYVPPSHTPQTLIFNYIYKHKQQYLITYHSAPVSLSVYLFIGKKYVDSAASVYNKTEHPCVCVSVCL